MIPTTEDRYAVDQPAGVVHRAYVPHAVGLPRTSYRGIAAYLPDPQCCEECWPTVKPQAESAGYYCLRCERRHLEGSAIHDAHLLPEPEDEPAQDVETDDEDEDHHELGGSE